MRTLARLALLASLAPLTDCASLPAIQADVCGNAVIDPGEDCDTFPTAPGTTCRPPSAPVGACRLDCTTGGDAECPSGWGCGADGICREPTGNFVRQSQVVSAQAWRVATGDFDGDQHDDVLARAAIDTGGYSTLRIQYYQANPKETDTSLILTPASTLALAPAVASPVVHDINGDGLADLAFISSGGLDVMLGQADGTLSPIAYPAFTDVNTSVVLGAIPTYGPSPSEVLLVFAAQTGSAPGIAINLGSQQTPVIATGAKGPGDLAGNLATGRLVEAAAQEACDQLVTAFSGDNEVDVYSPCVFQNGVPAPNLSGPITQVKLGAARMVDAGVVLGDVDGDGHLDLLVGADAITLVAYGDGKGNFTDGAGNANVATLLDVDFGQSPVGSVRLPLAAADLNDDGKADFVCPNGVYISAPAASAAPYVKATTKSTGQWTDARIADLNGDGLPDVVASANDELDAALLIGTGTTALNPFTIATAGTVAALAVGDFDGDRVNDVMLAQELADPSLAEQVTIAWGQAFQPPLPPAVVGQFATISQGVPLPQAGTTASDLVMVAHPAGTPTTAVVSILVASGDRQPLAPYLLTQSGSSSGASTPIAITAGPLTGSSYVDVALLAADATGFSYWLAAGTGQGQFDTPVTSVALPSGFSPFFTSAGATAPHDAALMGSGPVGPGGAEAVIGAAPYGPLETAAAFLPAQATQTPAITFESVDTFAVRVSPEGQLDFADIDGDGNTDIVLLSGADLSLNRTLYVAWGNGTGSFSQGDALTVNQPDELPQGFAFVHADTSGLPMIAYVTLKTAVVVTMDPTSRTVLARATVDTPAAATGIASGDIDGDGVDDLVEADSESIVVLHGVPVLP